MIHQFKKALFKQCKIEVNDKLLLAISGGLDSMVLLHLCSVLKLEIGVAHCNFGLRAEESEEEEKFVKNYCNHHKIEFYSIKFKTNEYAEQHSISTQMAARELRYDWFNSLLGQFNYKNILVAHHADDQVETILLNIIRGKGPSSWSGMNYINEKIVRPLLSFTKNEIKKYATRENLQWRDDSSNNTTSYERNFLRIEVLPLLEKINPNFTSNILQFGERAFVQNKLLSLYFESLTKEFVTKENGDLKIEIDKLNAVDETAQFLFHVLHPFRFNFETCENICSNLKNRSGKIFYSKTHRVYIDRNNLIVSTINISKTESIFIQQPIQYVLPNNSTLNFEFIPFSEEVFSNRKKSIAYLDADLITFPLEIRSKQEGDYFHPLGMNGTKLLSDYFIDNKYSLRDKEDVLLLTMSDSILWIINDRIDQRYRITEKTKTMLKIEFTVS
jgi:tRNA(Ile)-lysidine synthase